MDHDIRKLLDIMARLRDPEQGCPWDLKQDYASIVPHTLEEAYEVADTIERGALDELPDELGDLLFQVVFYARLGQEQGRFAFQDVVDAIVGKLIRRHPHVFADAEAGSDEQLHAAWEAQKHSERTEAGGAASCIDGVPLNLPALSRAAKLQRRAARVGFDWPDILGVLDKCGEEIHEVETELARRARPERVRAEIGDLLFSCVNLARHAGADPEQLLRQANARFEGRFRHMERNLDGQGRDMAEADPEELESLWQQAKADEKGA